MKHLSKRQRRQNYSLCYTDGMTYYYRQACEYRNVLANLLLY